MYYFLCLYAEVYQYLINIAIISTNHIIFRLQHNRYLYINAVKRVRTFKFHHRKCNVGMKWYKRCVTHMYCLYILG